MMKGECVKDFLVVVFALATFPQAGNAIATSSWRYKGDDGPQTWGGHCNYGKIQSPVNIDRTSTVKVLQYPAFVFTNYDRAPKKSAIVNNGQTARLTFDNNESGWSAKISGAGLPGTYQFAHLTFHWGSKLGQGSEHTLDGISYPMEMHLIHFNNKYGPSVQTALDKSRNWYDTLAILGVWFQIRSYNNTNLDPLIQTLDSIKEDGMKFQTPVFPLRDILPLNTDHYFRYNGSLTTPDCNEVVMWSVFKEPVDISVWQLKKFRALTYSVGKVSRKLHDNFRKVQPLNNRKIYEIHTYGISGANPLVARTTTFPAAAFTAVATVMASFGSRLALLNSDL